MSGEEIYDKLYANPRKGVNLKKGDPLPTQTYSSNIINS